MSAADRPPSPTPPRRRKKAPRVKRQFDRMLVLDSTNQRQVERLLPYGA